MSSNTKLVTYKQRKNKTDISPMPFSSPPVSFNNNTLSPINGNQDRNLYTSFVFFLHFLFNFIIIISFAFLLASFFYIIREEFRVKVYKEKQKLQMIREEAAYNYRINRCDIEIPFMKNQCLAWKRASENDEIQVGKLFVDSIGEMVDTFIQRISWKAFILLAIIGVIYIFINRNIR
ncbi:hypothetical protein CDIK_0165 [Cucumispora dikerogammari]|nr:hypothetical protein CDIK_0165 [Cucumispora dikerogammari]